jgi:hypothetical protein
MRFLRSAFLALGLSVSFWLPMVAHAQSVSQGYSSIMSQGLIFGNICSSASTPCPCRDSGKCELSDMLQIFVNISIGILAICGSVALLMFFYGGFTWVTSMGNAKKIEQGKEIIVRAVIGLAIIFGAYAFVNFLIAAISGTTPGDTIEQTVNTSTTCRPGQTEGCTPSGIGAENVLQTQ